jgi:hypothetical protein
LAGGVGLALGLDPCVAVGSLDNFIGHVLAVRCHNRIFKIEYLHVTLDLGVLEAASNETLRGKQGVLGVRNGLEQHENQV